MRKFGTTKRNPNPPWPNEQSVVMIPPGSKATSVGKPENRTYIMNSDSQQNERELRRDPIMSNNSPQNTLATQKVIPEIQPQTYSVSDYLSTQTGRYIKVEFLFGDNIHMEKNGMLEEVGKDFIVIRENGTNTNIVCASNKIKFINIYDYGK